MKVFANFVAGPFGTNLKDQIYFMVLTRPLPAPLQRVHRNNIEFQLYFCSKRACNEVGITIHKKPMIKSEFNFFAQK